MAAAQICPVVGTTTSVLPPNHPSYDASDSTLRCPVTNASVGHHEIIHNHPSSPIVPRDRHDSMDAQSCPALQNVNSGDGLTNATCPVVGPVSAMLPPNHPNPQSAEPGAVCPVTKATLSHHEGKVHQHPQVASGVCPGAGKRLDE